MKVYLATLPGYEPVESLEYGCNGCAFEGQPLLDSLADRAECAKVACFPEGFPEGHPMHSAHRIIWVKTEAAC